MIKNIQGLGGEGWYDLSLFKTNAGTRQKIRVTSMRFGLAVAFQLHAVLPIFLLTFLADVDIFE